MATRCSRSMKHSPDSPDSGPRAMRSSRSSSSAGMTAVPHRRISRRGCTRPARERALELQGRDFWHYGIEAQHYWSLGPTRVLGVRLYGEGVTGSVADVPYYDLPALGGDLYLRGYTFDRFRDRLAGFGELQYRWVLSSYAAAYLFGAAGRVYHAYDALSREAMRVGFGAGLSLLSGGGHFLADGMIGSSIDGGVVVGLSLTPVEDRTRSLP